MQSHKAEEQIKILSTLLNPSILNREILQNFEEDEEEKNDIPEIFKKLFYWNENGKKEFVD